MSAPAFVAHLAAVAVLAWAGMAHAQGASQSDAPAYKPPSRGAPKQTTGGGTRSAAKLVAPAVSVLAPDHTGYTTQDQPTLYWHLSKPTRAKIEIAVTDATGVKRIVEHVVARTEGAGIQAVSLRDLKVRLEPDTDYRWSVAMVPESSADPMNVHASGLIRYVPAPATLQARLAKSGDANRASIYAEEGYWYDAVDALARNVRGGPDSQRARSHLAVLLKQGGVRASVAE